MGANETIDGLQHPAIAGATPVVFGAAGSWCFGWFHPARAPRRGIGVVLCRPLGYEASCSYSTYLHLAQKLAAAGFDVFRFDYHGTGDSAGCDADPGRVAAWQGSTMTAIDQLKHHAGVSRVALFGVRIGGTLAVQAADRLGGVDSLVLWAPCVTGRAFVRELRAANAGRIAPGGDPASLEAYGHLYTGETLADLGALDCKQVAARPAARVLIIGRDDLPGGEAALAAKYRELGAEAQVETWPGYADMMVEPHNGRVELSTLDLITDWLRASGGAAAAPSAAQQPPRPTERASSESVLETSLAFGQGDALFGVLAEPVDPAARPSAAQTGVLLLNVGGHYRIGPGRIYVNLARALAGAGYRALRFDVAGFGDSRADPAAGSGTLYERDCDADIDAAIDLMIDRGCTRIVLLGICTGSFLAFQTALVDSRVDSQILLNTLRLERKPTTEVTDDRAIQVSAVHKSTHFYRRALLNASTYRRLLRGEVDLAGIASQFRRVIGTRMLQRAKRWLRIAPHAQDLPTQIRQLAARGTDTLVIVAAGDPARDYMELHLGRNGGDMRGVPRFRFAVIEGTDHTLADGASQRQVIDLVLQHLDRRLGADKAASPAAASAAG
ncbi:MAG: alpha/beta fold hydrolase [Proteobacteria bacterium]|nr:alpha/beta fold hydrolase [Pseudomonadota bacterium]